MHTPVGTLEYAAPEMLDGRDQPYNEMCDMWSIGVIAYTLLTDARPFAHVDEAGEIDQVQTRRQICSGRFYDKFLDPYGDKAKDFVKRCLEVDPVKRMSTSEAQSHPWLMEVTQKNKIKRSTRESMGSTLEQYEVTELRKYATMSTFSKGVKIALASRFPFPSILSAFGVLMTRL